jgi:hypothetical protein
MKLKHLTTKHFSARLFGGIFLCSLMFVSTGFAQDGTAESTPAVEPWQRQVFFGEEHMHTRNSFDAFTIGVNQTWDDAYNFAKGQEVKLSTTGEEDE